MLQNYWKLRIKKPQRIENCVMFSFFIRRRKNLIKWTRQRMAYYRAFSLTWPAASAVHPRRHRGSQSGREKRRDERFQARVLRGWQLCKFIGKKGSFFPTGLVCDTNMAAVLLFWDSSMTDVTSRENSLLLVICWPYTGHAGGQQQTSFPPLGT